MRRGTTVGGRYRLVRGPLQGSMGEVWIARDLRLPREVILKRLRTTGRGTSRSDRLEFDRLEAEARALARFSHPHVVTLHDVLTLPEGPLAWLRRRYGSWLVMEYVSGGSLVDRPPLSPERAARVGVHIAAALAALHAEGVVHGDVKPGNVVATAEGLAKLADFGAAYRVGGKETITPPPARHSYTPDYAAPEVVRGHPEPASDVFSLAALVHTLVTGAPPRPHAGEGVDAFVADRQAERGETALGPGLGPLAGILPAMLDATAKNRPTAAEARRLFERAAGPQDRLPPQRGGDDGDGAGPDSGAGPHGRGVHPGRSRQLIVAVGVAAVTLAAALLAPELWPDGGSDDGRGGGTAGSRVGEHRTADPCALADPAALKRFGDAQLDRDYGNFDRCDVIVDTGEGDDVDVEIHFDTGGAPEEPAPYRTVGRVALVKEADDSDVCVRTLLPADDPGVDISVAVQQDEGDAPLCAMADAAAERAVETLNRGPIARRPAPPAGSLVRQDACALLDAKTLEAIPGIDARDPDVHFGAWDCEWESTTGDLSLEVRFDRGQPPTADDGTLTRVDGRRAVVEPDAEGPRTCLVRVVHRTYTDARGDKAVETLNVTVKGDPSPDRLRRLATRFAAAAVRRAGAG
ncbi:serine/threonine-protein kinase [Streptomyces sp. NPDC059063]|uniref:serine/threonine-protein kinase n=1 Tax=unclassified Streptomyces TaxID=2593676 RepID=UPI0036D1577F